MLRRVVEAALQAPVEPVIAVLGANAAAIQPCLEGLPVHVIVNPDWSEGMGSSIRAGIKELLAIAPGARGAVVALADQPGFSPAHVAQLIEAQARSLRSIVASLCNGELMPPAFFGPEHFAALLALRGDRGARSLFQAHPGEVESVDARDLQDLDTKSDYDEFLKR